MTREQTVEVRLKAGVGAVNLSSGTRFVLSLKPGESALKWDDGSPITRSDFEAVLAPENLFEIVPPRKAQPAQEKE